MVDYLQRAFGYSLTGTTEEKAVFVPDPATTARRPPALDSTTLHTGPNPPQTAGPGLFWAFPPRVPGLHARASPHAEKQVDRLIRADLLATPGCNMV